MDNLCKIHDHFSIQHDSPAIKSMFRFVQSAALCPAW